MANKREVPYKGLPSHNNLTNKNSEPLVNIPALHNRDMNGGNQNAMP